MLRRLLDLCTGKRREGTPSRRTCPVGHDEVGRQLEAALTGQCPPPTGNTLRGIVTQEMIERYGSHRP